MVTNVVIKFRWTPMKIVGEIELLKIPAAYGPVRVRKHFKSGRFPQKVTFCIIMIRCIQFG